MASWKDITREEFDAAYERYQPKRWIKFAFKYFSKSTEKKNMKLSNWVAGILLALFGVGLLGTILKWSRALIGTVTIAYSIGLAILVLFLLAAVWANNARLKKIMKILGVNVYEYNLLVERFYP